MVEERKSSVDECLRLLAAFVSIKDQKTRTELIRLAQRFASLDPAGLIFLMVIANRRPRERRAPRTRPPCLFAASRVALPLTWDEAKQARLPRAEQRPRPESPPIDRYESRYHPKTIARRLHNLTYHSNLLPDLPVGRRNLAVSTPTNQTATRQWPGFR